MGRSSSEMCLQGNPADSLTDDLIVEILSRLPVKSVCLFKCVSWYWRRLIADPDHRKKLPQSLSGFFCSIEVDNDGDMVLSPNRFCDTEDEGFYDFYNEDVLTQTPVHDFASILPAEEEHSPVVPDPLLSFLPGYESIVLVHCCSGHLLGYYCYWEEEEPPTPTEESHYVVCNPATKIWRTFPRGHRHSTSGEPPLYLCLDDDPVTISSHFHVVALVEKRNEILYWFHQSVFLHGILHLITFADSRIVAVDRDGKTWNTIPMLKAMYDVRLWFLSAIVPFFGKSQGRLLFMSNKPND